MKRNTQEQLVKGNKKAPKVEAEPKPVEAKKPAPEAKAKPESKPKVDPSLAGRQIVLKALADAGHPAELRGG